MAEWCRTNAFHGGSTGAGKKDIPGSEMPLSTNMSNIFFLVYFSLVGWMSLRTFGIKRRESAFAQNLNVYHAHNSPHGVRMLRIEVIEISPIVRPVLRLPNAVVYILDLVRILPNFGIPDKRETTRYEQLVAEVRGIIGFRRLVSFLNPDGYRFLSVCEYHSSLLLFFVFPLFERLPAYMQTRSILSSPPVPAV